MGIDHGVGHPIFFGLTHSSTRRPEGSRWYLDRFQYDGKHRPGCSSANTLIMDRLELGLHLVELHLGDRKVPQQVYIDFMSLLRGSVEPHQDGFFRHVQHKANPRQIDLD